MKNDAPKEKTLRERERGGGDGNTSIEIKTNLHKITKYEDISSKQNKKTSKINNSSLHEAKKSKNDEFYTQLTDIEKEVGKYKEHLKGKTIYCNCDDPAWSNFVRYFIMQFNNFELKRLIATGYTVGKGALTIQTDFFDILDESIKKDSVNKNSYLDMPEVLKSSYYIDIKSVSPQLSSYFTENAENSLSNYDLLKILKKDNLIKDLVGDGILGAKSV